MVRTPSFDKNGIKKGAWSPEEDTILQSFVLKHGFKNWRQLPKSAGLKRCGKSCRLRWVNYLRPNVRRGNYSKQEEDLIIHLHRNLGNKWALIASKLPGRTDNEIKNHWHTHLKKRCDVQHNSAVCMSSSSDRTQNSSRDAVTKFTGDPQDQCGLEQFPILESWPLGMSTDHPQVSSSATSTPSSVSTSSVAEADNLDSTLFAASNFMEVFRDLEDDDFWNQPLTVDNMTMPISSSFCFLPSFMEDDDGIEQQLSSYMNQHEHSFVNL